MTIGVSYKDAAKVAVFAVIVGVTAPASIPAAVVTTVLGGLASHVGVEAANLTGYRLYNKYQIRKLEGEIARLKAEQLRARKGDQPYQIAVRRERREFDEDARKLRTQRAIERFRSEHPKMLKIYCIMHRLPQDNEGSILNHFLEDFKGGLCSGITHTLWDRAIETNENFSLEMLDQLDEDEIYYRQLQHGVYRAVRAALIFHSEAMQKHTTEAERFYKSLHPVTESEEFPSAAPISTYQDHFAKIAGHSPKNVLGAIKLPGHIIAFQWTKDGFFLNDSFSHENGGMFRFPNASLFFEKLRSLATYDIENSTRKEKLETDKVCFYLYNTSRSPDASDPKTAYV